MSNKLYTTIPAPKVPRNTFQRSRPNSLTMPFQRVVPTMLEEIYPGDRYNIGNEIFARLQPMVAPVMNNMKISNHCFFVPLRTINDHFAEFMFNNRNGDYSDVLPYTNTKALFSIVSYVRSIFSDDLAAEVIRLFDFIGLPFRYSSKTTAALFVSGWIADTWNTQVRDAELRINLAPFFAYTKIWSEYFRDENVEDDPFDIWIGYGYPDVKKMTGDVTSIVSGGNSTLNQRAARFAQCFLSLRSRSWAHDRFTSSLPFAQRGPDVLLPIDGTLPVNFRTQNTSPSGGSVTAGAIVGDVNINAGSSTNPSYDDIDINLGSNWPGVSVQGVVDFENSELTTTINTFRRAERLQRWYENSARGGYRPNEATLAHFGIHTPDATLDRAEFLGGTMQPIVVSEVAQTSESTQASPQGTLAGKGTSYKGSGLAKSFFTEHGFLFCLTSAIVRANYWQGIPKVFSRMQRDEYYWPEFANLGEEPVFTKEIFAGTGVDEGTVFGYVPRYSDLKSAQGEVHGDMRSSLAFWTQAREFSNAPQLNKEFLFGDTPLTPFAVQSQYTDPIIVTIQYNVKASRLMPFYGVPTI